MFHFGADIYPDGTACFFTTARQGPHSRGVYIGCRGHLFHLPILFPELLPIGKKRYPLPLADKLGILASLVNPLLSNLREALMITGLFS